MYITVGAKSKSGTKDNSAFLPKNRRDLTPPKEVTTTKARLTTRVITPRNSDGRDIN